MSSNELSNVKSIDYQMLAKQSVRALHPYLPGKPIDELQRELGISNIVKLASNENPLGLSSKVRAAIQASLKEGARYPDGNGFVLKKALIDYYAESGFSFEASQFTLGNGSNDVLEIIARTFLEEDDEVIFSEYAFAVYAIVTQAVGAKSIEVSAKEWGHDLDAMSAAITAKTKLIFLANPNNPTGTVFKTQELHRFLATVPKQVIVILDEAYGEYIEDPDIPDGLSFLSEFPNLIVSRTFSKAWGLASMRVGYAISSKDIAGMLNRVRQPFNVNSFALLGAAVVLSDLDYLEKGVAVNKQGMQQLSHGLAELGLEFIPSYGNFIAFSVRSLKANPKALSAQEVYQALLKEGVIVRPLANYKMSDHLRVSIGLSEENTRFLSALNHVLNKVD